MFAAYTKTRAIIFDDGVHTVYYPWPFDLIDFEDYFVIETEVEIDKVSRGWLGDITFVLSGYNLDEPGTMHENVDKEVTCRDALCVRRVFDRSSDNVVLWKYTFNKY